MAYADLAGLYHDEGVENLLSLLHHQLSSVLATGPLDEFAVIGTFLHLAHGEDVVSRLSWCADYAEVTTFVGEEVQRDLAI